MNMGASITSEGEYLRQVLDSHDEADRVEDVGLASAVEAGDRIERWVEVWQHDPLKVGLKALYCDFWNVHGEEGISKSTGLSI